MRQKDLFGVHYFKIQYGKVYKLLTSLGVETLSVFIDGGLEYSFYGLLTIDDFMDNVPQIKESLLIFDGEMYQCEMNKEIETLRNKKVLIGFDIAEKYTQILINLKNIGLPKKMIKQVLKQKN